MCCEELDLLSLNKNKRMKKNTNDVDSTETDTSDVMLAGPAKIRFESLPSISSTNSPAITREPVSLNKGKCFMIHSLLNEQECRFYIDETNKLGYESVDNEYPSHYRNSKRLLIISNELSRLIWSRLKPHLTREDLKGVKPFGFDNNGIWKPVGVNECFRFSRYDRGEFFKPHVDGMFVRNKDERSIFTVLLYLNDDFTGGETELMKVSETNRQEFELVTKLKPKAGTAVIFNQDLPHSGSPITQGSKYILRTDLMFYRTDSKSIFPSNYQTSEDYQRATELLEKSEECELAGEVEQATKYYLEAQGLQVKTPSVTKVSQAELIPDDSMFLIFEFLTAKDVAQIVAVNRNWNEVGREGRIWKMFYCSRWPDTTISLLEERLGDADETLHDWYYSYRMRSMYEKKFCAVLFDLGANSIHVSLQNQKPIQVPSLVGKPNHGHFYMQGYGMDDYICGELNASSYHVDRTFPIENGEVQNFLHLQQLIEYIYDKKLKVGSEAHPVLLSRSPGFSHNTMEQLAKMFFKKLHVPAICYADESVLALLGSGRQTGLYITVDDAGSTVIAVHDSEQLDYTLRSNNITKARINKLIHKALEQNGASWIYNTHYRQVWDAAYVAKDYREEVKKVEPILVQTYNQNIRLKKYAILAPEYLFVPKGTLKDEKGITQLIIETLNSIPDESVREEVMKGAVLTGSFLKLPGLQERIVADVRQTFPSFAIVNEPRLDVDNELEQNGCEVYETTRDATVIQGAKAYASLSNFKSKCMIMDAYASNGFSLFFKNDKKNISSRAKKYPPSSSKCRQQ